ncbi:30S ribosomal protein S1 [Thiospirochaeta perfilievii]|uniref:30S ribosomal protein S1 n=1 Tax=Thiospirochaeta perfilievii TaxID=252967 RepID=UPI001FED58B0|nr:S1 RNA-binding domain-containing protein [Thiospirochaeta perfilievii]
MSLNKFDEKEEDFASLLENSFTDIKVFTPGEVTEADIVAISGGCVFIQLDGKSEGQIDSEELLDEHGAIKVKVGEKIKAYFVEAKNGDKIFTTKIAGNKAGKESLKSAYESGIPVEGSITAVIKGGYDVKIGDTRVFCPFSQIGLKRVENPEVLVGTRHTFKIIEYKEGGRNILVSSRVLLEEELEDKVDILKQELEVGMPVDATVISLEKFGAFVDVKGVRALLPISEISRSRVDDISNFLTVGQEIKVAILNLDWDNKKISVSKKQLIKDPWDEVTTKYKENSRHSGDVSRITKFGIFVTLEPGIDGLIHISDITQDNFKVGQKISVEVKSIDAKERRIGLKEVASDEEYNLNKKYFDSDDDNDTYNPFAALLKGKK